jgi:hypothetical protein
VTTMKSSASLSVATSALLMFAPLAAAQPGGAASKDPKLQSTRAQPLYTDTYEIRDLLGKPQIDRRFGTKNQDTFNGRADLAGPATQVVHAIVTQVDPASWREGTNSGSIEIINGTRLVVRASAERHRMLADFLHTLRRIADVAVSAQARLYEVDEAFYNKLKNAKRIPLDELEKQFVEGRLPKDDLQSLLAKQKPVVVGDEIKTDKADSVRLLSHLRAVVCRMGPGNATDNKDARVVFEGVAFLGKFRVSVDRRSVQLRLTEKAVAVQEVRKVRTFVGSAGIEALTEIPFLNESTHQQVLEIPDGGSILIPVYYRPQSLAAKNRWWVLSISARIRIEAEEERQLVGPTKKE